MNKFIYLLLITLGLTGCSGLLTSNQNIDQFYTVNALPDYYDVKTGESHEYIDTTMIIQTASVSKGLDGNKIILMHSPQRVDYYANARWSSQLSTMVQTSLIESFENSDVLDRVGSDFSSMHPEYALMLEIQDFQAEYQEEASPPTIHIKLVGKLVQYPEHALMASFTVETYKQAEENEVADIVRAFDEAFAGAQALLIEETLDYFAQ
ncbi:MAG: ABC-type transport auxiliary lipoprotein family protein [Gammaproteobacteria bacterium]|jgi:cholesterol transport system auxiliary component